MDDDKIKEGVLGISGSPVPKKPGDPTTDYDPDSVAQRRARMRQGEAEAETEASEHGHGATGIDMGAVGEGTDIKPPKP